MISSPNAAKLTQESQSPSTVCRKSASSNSILCQFCSCWVHKWCSGIRGKLEKDSNFKCQASANHHAEIAENFPGIGLNGQSVKIVEKFCYLGGTVGARGVADDIIYLPLKAKNALYSICACSIILHGRETRLVQVK